MTDISIYRQNFEDERNSAAIYETLASVEKDPRLAEVYRRIAETEQKHAAHWAEKIQAVEGKAPEYRPNWRTRMLLRLGRRFGPSMVLPAMQNMERQGSQGYSQQVSGPESQPAIDMARQENSHARLISQITAEQGGGMEGGTLALLEGRHRSTGGNALRAAVLGANDGLVSNLSLVMGVAGATFNNRTVLITGLAGLLAGAISMALGEWLSVQSSRELFSHQIKIEAAEVATAPEEEAEELSLIYQARGLSKEQADNIAGQLLANPQSAVDTLAREELGVDPAELGGSAWEAALTSFILFAIGAIIPVIAFTFLTGMTAVIVSILCSTVGLFILGAVITLFTGKPVWYSGLRMVIFGLIAAVVTFGLGRLIGTSIAG